MPPNFSSNNYFAALLCRATPVLLKQNFYNYQYETGYNVNNDEIFGL